MGPGTGRGGVAPELQLEVSRSLLRNFSRDVNSAAKKRGLGQRARGALVGWGRGGSRFMGQVACRKLLKAEDGSLKCTTKFGFTAKLRLGHLQSEEWGRAGQSRAESHGKAEGADGFGSPNPTTNEETMAPKGALGGGVPGCMSLCSVLVACESI